MKKNQPDFWIFKFDLNDHSDALSELTENQLCSSEDAVQFLGEKIMKLKSDFEKSHFVNSCTETGKVILLIDGFDEIFSSYGEEVVDLVKLLLQTKIEKFFISTRPECCELLEKEFLQIKHSLQPFSESDRKEYFTSFLKNKSQFKNFAEKKLEKIVEAFVESMKRSISAKDYKHTGVPLVTKLVAEFLASKIDQADRTKLDETIENLKMKKFNLLSLYKNFISNCFHIYFKEKCGMDLKNAVNRRRIKQEEKKIMANFKIFAIQQFLKNETKELFPDFADKIFTDDEIEEMAKVGLIYKTEDGYKFVHQTFTEYLFTLYLMENFEQPEVAGIIVHFVFVEERFEVIRSFIDSWIEEKMTPEVYEIYFEIFLSQSPIEHKTTPIHVSLREHNSNILNFIYNCLTKSSKFKKEKSKIEEYFFECGEEWKVPPIFELITWSENFDQILDSIKSDFGAEFVRKIFQHKIQFHFFNGYNLLLHTSWRGENLPELLKWLRLNFSDSNFLQQQIFSVDSEKLGILHRAFWHLPNKILLNLLEEIRNWKKVLGADEFEYLILMEDFIDQFFVFHYAENFNFDTDFLIEILEKIREIFFANDEEKFLTKIIFNVNGFDQTCFHYLCKYSKNFELLKVLKWFSASFGSENLKKLLSLEDYKQNSIVFKYFSNERVPLYTCLEILSFLKVALNLNEIFIKNEIILRNNEKNENILQLIFIRTENFDDFVNFVENSEFEISDSELKSALTGSENLLFDIAEKLEENQKKILKFL